MNFFGSPIEVWVATVIAVLIKLRNDTKLTLLGIITTFATGVGSGMLFYHQVADMLGLDQSWHVAIACIVTLTADNLMKVLLELSSDREWIKDWIKYLVTRDEGHKRDDNNDT